MFNRKTKIVLLTLVISMLSLTVFYYYHTSKFKRAYIYGTTYNQLNSLLNTTQYAKNIEHAGFNVDPYYLKINQRAMPIDIGNNIEVSYIDKTIVKVMVILPNNKDISMTYDSDMNIEYCYGDIDGSRKQLTQDQSKIYDKEIKKTIKNFLTAVYNDMYR